MDVIQLTLTYQNKHLKVLFDEDGEVWFKSKDVADILGYKNQSQACSKYVMDSDKQEFKTFNDTGEHPSTIFINHSGLLSLILCSNLRVVKNFKHWVTSELLPSVLKHGEFTFDNVNSEENLRLKEELEYTKRILRSESEKSKKLLELNQATKKVDETEYIYICTTDIYQSKNLFKVGGVENFQLLKSRLSVYNSGESVSNLHYLVYARKCVNYKSVENLLKGLLLGFREEKNKENYIIAFYWLHKILDEIIDDGTSVLNYININRNIMVDDTLKQHDKIVPIQLESIQANVPKDCKEIVLHDSELIENINKALETYNEKHEIKRIDFLKHLENITPVIFKKNKKHTIWKIVKFIGPASVRYKY